VSTLSQYHEKNRNVIFSFESLGTVDFMTESNMRRIVSLKQKWDVHVYTAYRHYHEWVPSLYSEQYKFHVLNDQMGVGKGRKWPDEGGIAMKGFADSVDAKFEKPTFAVMEHVFTTNSLSVYRQMVEMFGTVKVLDIHVDGWEASWVCALPGANVACDALLTQKQARMNSHLEFSTSFHISCDLLALAAHERGVVPEYLERASVRAAIAQHAEGLGAAYSFPLRCLSASQEEGLYSLSLLLARALSISTLPADSFSKYKADDRFCGVDEEKALAEEVWISFFQELGDKPLFDSHELNGEIHNGVTG
jgi:hypothetical protein